MRPAGRPVGKPFLPGARLAGGTRRLCASFLGQQQGDSQQVNRQSPRRDNKKGKTIGLLVPISILIDIDQ